MPQDPEPPEPWPARPADPGFRSGPPAVPATEAPPLPAPLAEMLEGSTWEQIWVKAGTEVWRIAVAGTGRAATGTTRYLKTGPAGGLDGIAAEGDRLAWLGGREGTPEVVARHVDGATGWLLTAEVPGIPAHDPRFRMGSVEAWLAALGRSLRRFHDELPVQACPFDARVDILLASVRRRVAAGGVDPSTLGSTYQRYSAEQLLEHLLAMRPPEPADDLVVAHGDPCLPNFLMSPAGDAVTGVVDVGRLGVSDRYRDIAIIVRSLSQNVGPDVAYVLLDAYGIAQPDLMRLEFYVLLDEMW